MCDGSVTVKLGKCAQARFTVVVGPLFSFFFRYFSLCYESEKKNVFVSQYYLPSFFFAFFFLFLFFSLLLSHS